MHRSDFHYNLPEELIAQYPTKERGMSRLLCLLQDSPQAEDRSFSELPDLLRPGDLLVFNDTRVMRARMFGNKLTGGKLEILVERLLDAQRGLVHIRSSKSPKAGSQIVLEGGGRLDVLGRQADLYEVRSVDQGLSELMQRCGHMPLPPYINREDGALDETRYQTVYSKREGAVAAPTAGLHFDHHMLDRLQQMGVESAHVTLHVGAGTFRPVRVENLNDHLMHSEYVEVSAEVCEQVARTRAQGGRVVAVGTTSVRSLEAASTGGRLQPFCGDTRLFITPGYRFCSVDALITNFHLPESTLLMLVAAFAGYPRVMQAYAHAVESGYRFFSYGDAMFLEMLQAD